MRTLSPLTLTRLGGGACFIPFFDLEPWIRLALGLGIL